MSESAIAEAQRCEPHVSRRQFPRASGPGVCFEAAELDPETLSGLVRLFRETGFVGVFDIEFALDGDQHLLIDFNPRFYNHMAFEIDRGLALPWFAYLAAIGQEERLHDLAASATLTPPERSGVYVHRLPMQLTLLVQRLTGGRNGRECREWRRWMRRHRKPGLLDPALAERDRLPAVMDVAQHVRESAIARPYGCVRAGIHIAACRARTTIAEALVARWSAQSAFDQVLRSPRNRRCRPCS